MVLKIFKFISYGITVILLLLLIALGVALFFFKENILFLINNVNTNINNIINETDSAFQNMQKFDYNAIVNLLNETTATLEAQLNNPNINNLPPEIKETLLRSITQLKQLKIDLNSLNLEEIKNQVGSVLGQVKQINSNNIAPFFTWINTYYQPVSLGLLIFPSIFLAIWLISGIIQKIMNKKRF
ncbi:MAG: hypothetical protein ACRDAW_02615 [Metamycoplasmataceae bacterium]